jgi:hypothetical protein
MKTRFRFFSPPLNVGGLSLLEGNKSGRIWFKRRSSRGYRAADTTGARFAIFSPPLNVGGLPFLGGNKFERI